MPKMPGGSSKVKPKASEVAAETRRHYIPLIKKEYSHLYKTYSYLFQQPVEQLPFDSYERPFRGPPSFCKLLFMEPYPCLLSILVNDRGKKLTHCCPGIDVTEGDPADVAMGWASQSSPNGGTVPLICSANDKRPGGDWETGVHGYEVSGHEKPRTAVERHT